MAAASSNAALICASAAAMAGFGPTRTASAARRMRAVSRSCLGLPTLVECWSSGIFSQGRRGLGSGRDDMSLYLKE